MADDRNKDELDRRIAKAKAATEHHVTDAEGRAESRGWAIGIEFVGSVLVGAFIGYLLDRWLGTMPWLMILFLFLGFAAGLRRAMKASNQFDADPTNDDKK